MEATMSELAKIELLASLLEAQADLLSAYTEHKKKWPGESEVLNPIKDGLKIATDAIKKLA